MGYFLYFWIFCKKFPPDMLKMLKIQDHWSTKQFFIHFQSKVSTSTAPKASLSSPVQTVVSLEVWHTNIFVLLFQISLHYRRGMYAKHSPFRCPVNPCEKSFLQLKTIQQFFNRETQIYLGLDVHVLSQILDTKLDQNIF